MSGEHQGEHQAHAPFITTGSSALNLDSFTARAANEADESLAADLLFGSAIAEDLQADGSLALVVGGFPRDAVIEQVTGQPQSSKDIDMEVYGLGFEAMCARLATFGKVDLVGASFGIAKVTNPASKNVLDFSIPRADSKVAAGHKGFQVTGDPHMSVAEAARRRDLTMNALAMNPLTGELIDEYGGVEDIRNRTLRATDMELFGDDPLRVLRVMQFAGRFNFKVHPATAELCKTLDLTELSQERIGEEWVKLMTKSERPSGGLTLARSLDILDQLHPELAVLDTIEQEPEWHPEGNVWVHTMLAADAAATVVREEGLVGDEALIVLFGALCHDLGKATTTEVRKKGGQERITAYNHEEAGVEPTGSFLEGLKMKQDVVEAVLPIVRHHLYHVHNPQPTDKQLQRFAQRLQPASIRLWDLVSRCDSNARGKPFTTPTHSFALYERSLELKVAERPAPMIVQGRDLIAQLGLKPGPAFGVILERLYDAQIGDEYRTVEEGIAYYRTHEEEIQELVAEHAAH